MLVMVRYHSDRLHWTLINFGDRCRLYVHINVCPHQTGFRWCQRDGTDYRIIFSCARACGRVGTLRTFIGTTMAGGRCRIRRFGRGISGWSCFFFPFASTSMETLEAASHLCPLELECHIPKLRRVIVLLPVALSTIDFLGSRVSFSQKLNSL